MVHKIWPGSFEGRSFDNIYHNLLRTLSRHPQHVCSPRGSKVKEFISTTLVLSDPKARLLASKKRDTNYGFAVGEFLWYWNGQNDLETMLYYNKRMKDFSDDGETLNSAYGNRLRSRCVFADTEMGSGETQWETTRRTLVDDPDSRRAVMVINLPEDQRNASYRVSKDVPCTLSLQFFIRDGKLDMHVVMRSNDVVWGLSYDLFSFTLMQECMMLELRRSSQFKDLQIGMYYHTAGSLHAYERHFNLVDEIVAEYEESLLACPYVEAGPMEPISSLHDLDHLAFQESLLRRGEIGRIDTMKYDGCLHWMAEQLNAHREKRDAGK